RRGVSRPSVQRTRSPVTRVLLRAGDTPSSAAFTDTANFRAPVEALSPHNRPWYVGATLCESEQEKGVELIPETGTIAPHQRYGDPNRRATRARKSASDAVR